MTFRFSGATAALAVTAAAAAVMVPIAPAPALAAGPLTMTTRIMVERRSAAPDGTTRTALVPAVRAVPGDRLSVVLVWRNTGTAPLADLVLANPVPRDVAYRGAADGSPAPDVSVDGRTYGALADLRVAMADGTTRPAGVDDVTHVRWRLPSPVAAGRGGELAFRAILK